MSVAGARRIDTPAAGLSTIAVLSGVALFALIVRVGWLLWHGPSEITWDGADYARAAANLIAGHGYVGIRGTTMFVFPPLYPLTIAALLPLSSDAEHAGLNVSLLSGAAFVFPIFGIAATLYGRRVGMTAAVIAACLPFAVQLSTVVLADMLFLTLAATGIHYLLRVTAERRIADAIACGVSLALAYLARPEGVLFWCLAIAVALAPVVVRPAEWRRNTGLALAIIVPFAALAAPYVTFLSVNAGHLRIEGKSLLNLDIGLRMQRGMSYTVAADAIDGNLVQVGPELAQDYYFEPAGRARPDMRTVLAFGMQNMVRHVREITHVATSRLCGTVLLLLLAAFGFVAGPWTRRRASGQAILLAYGVIVAVSLGSVYHFWDRYFVGFVPLLIVWAANGVDAVVRMPRARLALPWVNLAAPALAGVFLIALLFSNKARFLDDAASLAERDAGMWLSQHGGAGARILSISDQAVFYAAGTWSMLPYAPDAGAALRYVQKEQPNFVVLDGDYANERPYIIAWLTSGIPDARARRVYAGSEPGVAPIAIVQWTRDARP